MSAAAKNAVRSEFLFCYDARMMNPNGDPDENRPRIDLLTKKNLVTDFRLKRTVRDYLWKNLDKKVFIRAEEDDKGNLKRIDELAEPYIQGKKIDKDRLLRDHIDIRLFGVLFAVHNFTFKRVGPVQFAIGQSLNPVEEIPLRMTRIVPTKEEAQAGTFGEKFVLRYSFILFHGFLNDVAAVDTQLTENDVSLLLTAMWHGTNNLSTTSKYGQQSRLLLRVRYKEPLAYIGDLDRRIALSAVPPLTDIGKAEDLSQVILDVTKLSSVVDNNSAVLSGIDYLESPDLVCMNDGKKARFSEVFTKKVSLNQLS
jgi:CRISPR-associated protein Csh2